MSSDYDTYGKLMAKNVYLDESGLRFHDANDDSKSITLKAQGIQAGNADLTLPVDAGALLSSASDLNASKITGINNLAPETIVDGDTFMFADASDTHAPKRALASELKTYVGAVPSGTSGQVLVYDVGNNAAAVNMSGDVAIDNAGATTLQNDVVTNAMVAAGAAIEKSKLAALEIANADVAAGAAIEKSKLAALDIADADVAAGAAIAGSKVDPDFGAQTVETTGTVQCGASDAFRLGGDSDGSFRMTVDSGNFVIQKKVTGTWETWLTVADPA